MNNELLLTFRGLSKQFGNGAGVCDIDLDVPARAVMALLGPNGAGKSTLLGCLLGLLRPGNGDVERFGRMVRSQDRLCWGYLPERLAVYPQRTLWENGRFFARLRGQTEGELERQLERVGLSEFRRRKAKQLSKGMTQRLGLALALCGEPELIVLDEPFNGLDPLWLDELQGILKAEHARGATLLVATHTLPAVESLATHVVILFGGRVREAGKLEALRARYGGEGSLQAVYRTVASACSDEGAEEARGRSSAPQEV